MRSILSITLNFILLGLLFLYVNGVYNIVEWWDKVYYLWDKTKDVLLCLCVVYLLSNPQTSVQWKKAFKCLALFCVIRLVWQILAAINYPVAASPKIMFEMFIILVAVIGFIFLSPALKRK